MDCATKHQKDECKIQCQNLSCQPAIIRKILPFLCKPILSFLSPEGQGHHAFRHALRKPEKPTSISEFVHRIAGLYFLAYNVVCKNLAHTILSLLCPALVNPKQILHIKKDTKTYNSMYMLVLTHTSIYSLTALPPHSSNL
jgi:hypothetical protein